MQPNTSLSRLRSQYTRDAVRRFFHLGHQTIARHLIHIYPDLYLDKDGHTSLDVARQAVRYVTGRNGQNGRNNLADKSLVRESGHTPAMPPTWNRARPAYHLDPGTWLVLSDAHVPFHELKPIEAAIQAGHAEQVTGILLNGDWWDCAAVSYWPATKRDFHREVEASIDSLDFLRGEFPQKKIIYKPGNHEYRLPRYFIQHAPELVESPLAAMETVMGFEQRGIEFLDYFQLVYAGKLPILHGHEVPHITSTVNPARGLFLRIKSFGACSHCHSTSENPEKTLDGTYLTTWSFGCLCNLTPDYAAYGNRWNWGFSIVHVEKNGQFEVINRRVLPNGKAV